MFNCFYIRNLQIRRTNAADVKKITVHAKIHRLCEFVIFVLVYK